MCFCVLLTGCVDIWEGIEGDERVYEINEVFSGDTGLRYYKITEFYNTEFSFYNIKLKRNNTVELRRYYDDDEQTVSNFGNVYAGYNAQYKDCNVIYGTYKQTGDRLKITFAQYTDYDKMEVSGEVAEAFKRAYVKFNPDEAEIFDKGIVQNDDPITKKLTLLVSDNECKPLNFEV